MYGTIASPDVHMQNFHRMEQGKNERLQIYPDRLEGVLSQIRVRFPSMISEVEMECHLRARFFYSMNKTSSDSLWYLYDDHHNSYIQ